ncbi:MAG: SAM-dependent methyltransferase [Myxococcales bacterium]|nr:SAM-dependent methyltransferase [Myxococcales bacterium]
MSASSEPGAPPPRSGLLPWDRPRPGAPDRRAARGRRAAGDRGRAGGALLTIPGIGASRAARVTATYTQHRHLADTTTLLGAHGATAAFASRMGRHGGVAIWLPTSPAVVAAMLDLAQVTAADELIDLGAGDGVIVIAAAQRGARGLGVESNPELIATARRNAIAAGVAHLAEFAQADLFEADLSRATVITLFLGPAVNRTLRPRLLALTPGTRIVSNAWAMAEWAADGIASVATDGWRSARLWIVPADRGAWRATTGTLALAQTYQVLTGTVDDSATPVEIADSRVRRARFEFRAGAARYAGAVDGDALVGTVERDGVTRAWRATRP